MSGPPFGDRLSEDYVAGEPVSCGYRRGERIEWTVDIPRRAFDRLSQLATAYDLHVLSSLDYWGEADEIGADLTRTQSEELATELDFIRSVVNDPVTDRYAAQLAHLAVQVSRSPFADQTLRIVGP